MAPYGIYHLFSTDWLTMLLASVLFGRAIVRIQGSIRLHNFSEPEPDVAVLRMRSFDDIRPYYPDDVYFVIEVADSSLRYDRRPPSWRVTPPPASPRSGSPTCGCAR